MSNLHDKLLDVLSSVDFGQRYLSYCRGTKDLKTANAMWVVPEAVEEAVDRLPLKFRYMKKGDFFRYEEDVNGSGLRFQLSITNPIVTPLIYLKTEGEIIEDSYAGLAIDILDRDETQEQIPEREFALCYSSSKNLYDAFKFSTDLFMEFRAALLKTAPWSGQAE